MNNEIENLEDFVTCINKKSNITNKVFQSLNLKEQTELILQSNITHCIFLGCLLENKAKKKLLESGNFLFPKLNVSFDMYKNCLYNSTSLYKDFNKKIPESYRDTPDCKIYEEYINIGREGENIPIQTTLARRLHDHAISDALYDYLATWDSLKIVAIMGGHNLSRQSEDYKKILTISKTLTEKGYLLTSGGGPGAMEATHLGAWMASRPQKEVEQAIAILSKAPTYNHKYWLTTAFDVLERFPNNTNTESLAIPTWFYGHEPSTPFATHIAKYFANSVREEGLLAIAKGGIVFSPGSAGTIQEIFQEAAQNHYKTYGNVSPMVFLDKKYWTQEKPVYPLLKKLSKGMEYKQYLSISNSPQRIITILTDFTEKQHGYSTKTC